MMQFMLLFSLILPAFGAGSRSVDSDEERLALVQLQIKFQRFRATTSEIDAKFAKLRLAVERHRYTEAGEIAADISRQIGVSRRQWREIDTFYSDSKRLGMNFHRQNMVKRWNLDASVVAFLAFKKNDRFGTGMPLELQMASWLGLAAGQKREALPSNLRRKGEIGGFPLKAYDSLLIVMNDGGIIRGRFEGFSDGLVVLREVLPNTLGIVQRNQGWYRILDITPVARVEIIRKPETVTAQETPPPIISTEGDYSPYYVTQDLTFRIDSHPDNMQLLKLVKEQRFADAEYQAKTVTVDLESESRPAYAEIYFMDCEDLLRRTP